MHIKENPSGLQEHKQGENAIIYLQANKTHTTSIQGEKKHTASPIYKQKHVARMRLLYKTGYWMTTGFIGSHTVTHNYSVYTL
jgi:hypothetical protein